MAFDNNPRPMIHGNWKCSTCGAEITELPFEPSPDRPISCKECWAKKRNSSRDNRSFAPRQMVQGNWKCAECGAEIQNSHSSQKMNLRFTAKNAG